MSWHTSGILIHADHTGDPVDLLAELGFAGAEPADADPIAFDEAISMMMLGELDGGLGASLAIVDGWTSLWGPLLVGDEEALARLSRAGDVVTVILEGASGTYGFELYREGHPLRRWLEQAGQVILDEGEPLNEERDSRDSGKDGEGLILDLLERLALPIERLDAVEYTTYRVS